MVGRVGWGGGAGAPLGPKSALFGRLGLADFGGTKMWKRLDRAGEPDIMLGSPRWRVAASLTAVGAKMQGGSTGSADCANRWWNRDVETRCGWAEGFDPRRGIPKDFHVCVLN